MALEEFLRTYDLDDKGVDAITRAEEGRVRFVFELFHCDDPERNDETKEYRLTALFRSQDVDVHEGELRHEEGEWLGTVLDLQAGPAAARIGIEWRSLARNNYAWTSLSLLGGPVWVEETVTDRLRVCRMKKSTSVLILLLVLEQLLAGGAAFMVWQVKSGALSTSTPDELLSRILTAAFGAAPIVAVPFLMIYFSARRKGL